MATEKQLKYWNSLKGKKPTEKQLESLKLGRLKGKVFSESWRKKSSDRMKKRSLEGKHPHWKGGIGNCICGKKLWRRGAIMCRNCYYNRPHKDVSLLKRRERVYGDDSASSFWRKEVYKRDNWKCKMNNSDCNGRLEAHHILPWRDYKELRYEINNGITLCRFHHPRKYSEEKRLSPYFNSLILKKENV